MKDDFTRNVRDMAGALDDFTQKSDVTRAILRTLAQEGLGGLARSIKETGDKSREARSSLRGLLHGLVDDITQYAVRNMAAPSSGLAGILSGFRADGGSVAPNGAYMVGERGPEILLTGRSSGFVSPMAAGKSAAPVSITVINNSHAQVKTQEQPREGGGRDITFMIDDMVAGVLSEPDSRSARALRTRFGIAPVLTQR